MSVMSYAAIGIIVAFVLTAVAVPFVKRLAFAIGAIDQPNKRKVHQKVMPRLGGVAIFFGFWGSVILTQSNKEGLLPMAIGAMILLAVGIIDDMKELPAKVKLVGQILAASVVAIGGPRIEFVTNVINHESDMLSLAIWMSVPITIIWIIAIINAVNLIDGLDGLAAGISAIASLTMSIVALGNGQEQLAILLFILFGSCLGFLPYNFHPASIFMGDCGSMFLGHALAVFSLMGTAKSVTFISVVIPILILGVPIFDTLFAIVRRMLSGQPIFQADKAHLHHQFLKRGFSHRTTVLIIYALSAVLSVCALIMDYLTTEKSLIFSLILITAILFAAGKFGIIGKLEKKTNDSTQEEEEHE